MVSEMLLISEGDIIKHFKTLFPSSSLDHQHILNKKRSDVALLLFSIATQISPTQINLNPMPITALIAMIKRIRARSWSLWSWRWCGSVLLLISWQEFSQVNIFLNLNWNSTRFKFLVKLVLENKQQLGVCIQAINSQQCNSQAYMLQSRSTRKCKIYRFAQLLFTESVSGHK
jgi:hypothetical protein